MSYITKDELKLESQLVKKDVGFASDGEFDGFLDNAIIHAQGAVEEYCGVPANFFSPNGYIVTDELCDYIPDGIVDLKFRPVLAVQKVEVDQAAVGSASDWLTLAANDYIAQLNAGIIHLINSFPARLINGVRVSYTAGYMVTPPAVKNAVLESASNLAHTILQRKLSPTVRVDDYTLKLVTPNTLTSEVKRGIDKYKRRFR
jgi:hypothetical protein